MYVIIFFKYIFIIIIKKFNLYLKFVLRYLMHIFIDYIIIKIQ